MKRFIKISIFLILITNLLFGISSQELADDINSAGRGRMLIQKMTKEALLIKSNFDKEQNIEILRKSSNKFDDIFSKLPTLDSIRDKKSVNFS